MNDAVTLPLPFAQEVYVARLMDEINANARYQHLASEWEGPVYLEIKDRPRAIFLDLWHGTCRSAASLERLDAGPEAYVFTATLANWQRLCEGMLNPVTAMALLKLRVQGNMAYVMKFSQASVAMVSCTKAIPTDWDI